MTRDDKRNGSLLAIFLLVGVVSWSIAPRQRRALDTSPLAALPHTIGDWHSRDIPIEKNVESMLQADFNIQRAYVNSMGDLIWLYIGYYGTERGGKPEHTPDVCYTANGWKKKNGQIIELSGQLATNEYLIEKDNEQRLVLFWFRSSRSTGILGPYQLAFDHFLNRVRTGRADGSLIRISTPIRKGRKLEARQRLIGFAQRLDSILEGYWPSEKQTSQRRTPMIGNSAN